MDPHRRSVRYLEPKDDSRQTPTNNPYRASTADSGRGSMTTSERASALDSSTGNSTLLSSSSLARNTPFDEHDTDVHENFDQDKPVRIRRTCVLGKKCYEQAFVSHVDHPSAFFLQLAHLENKYEELQKEINQFYSKSPIINASSSSWKRGDYCIAKYTKDNQFYRARIIEVPQMTKTDNLYDVVYLDYGNWSKVSSTDIYPILPKFACLPAQAVPCSLAKTLPLNGTWCSDPTATKLFEEIVLEKFVDATFYLKSSRDFWPLSFVDLRLCSSKLNVREYMKSKGLILEVPNENIFQEFYHLLKPADYIIYSIPHEAEENNDDDDDN
ncbi:unnamed protein product [Rotaria sp. Silwood2]|nr:unnamed protein product [Rotaria sp. Silwood2]CAF4559195.1 unnamed protein product [Rotaria sp. Silwood2]